MIGANTQLSLSRRKRKEVLEIGAAEIVGSDETRKGCLEIGRVEENGAN